MADTQLSHVNESGQAHMVDVSDKDVTARLARAQAVVEMAPATAELVRENGLKKGDVLSVARIAGIQAAKKCSDLIPLCHPLALSKVEVEFELRETTLIITTLCKVSGKTGVEMEALTAASVAALTVYDMCKAVDRDMTIGAVCLLAKEGGKSGAWSRDGE